MNRQKRFKRARSLAAAALMARKKDEVCFSCLKYQKQVEELKDYVLIMQKRLVDLACALDKTYHK